MTGRTANLILFLCCLMFFVLAYITMNVNPPFGIATLSRALYVDEGFYSDAAQNFVKFGDWGLAHDLRHWPGAPMLTILQTAVFSVFGISVTAARLISVAFGLIGVVSLYFITRIRFEPGISLFMTIAAGSTISFASHSRAAIADPIAVGFSMLALLFYLRLNNRLLSIPLSLLAAYFAFFSKMYFLFVPVTLIIFWLIDIVVIPYKEKFTIVRSQIYMFVVTLTLIISSYVLLRFIFDDSFAEFMHINSNKIPVFDLVTLVKQFVIAVEHVPFNTKTHIFVVCIVLLFAYLIVSTIYNKSFLGICELASRWGREGWILTVFLLLGFGTITALNIPTKAHYYYFSILPICFLTVLGLKILLPKKTAIFTMLLVLISHLILQAFYYSQWLNRTELYAIDHANKSIIDSIEKENPGGDQNIAIIGQYASQLGLYSDRLMPLDLRWSTKTQLCNRVAYWRPKYLVDFHFPARGNYSKDILLSCEQIADLEEISRLSVFDEWQDELLFNRIIYNN